MQECPPRLANLDITRLARGDDHNLRQRDQVLGMRARKAGRVVNDSGIVARRTALTIGVSNARAVGKMRTLPNDASTAVNVQSESASASVGGTVMETENGIGNTASANEIPNEIERGANVNGTVTGTGTASVTGNEVIGTDGMKRIGIGRAGKIATSVVELCCLWKTAVNPLVRDIVPRLLQRIHSGSEEELPMMTYVLCPSPPLHGASSRIHSSCPFCIDSPTVPRSAAPARRVAKIAVGGLLTRRKTTNVPASQIGVAEIAKKMAMHARHPKRRCDLVVTPSTRSTH